MSTEEQISKTFRDLIASQGGILLRVDELWSPEHSQTRNVLIESISRASFEDPKSGPRFGALYDFARRAGTNSEAVTQAFHNNFTAMRVAGGESSISTSEPAPPGMRPEGSVKAPATLNAERVKRRLRVWEDLRAFARTGSQSTTYTLLSSLESLGAISSQGVFISLPHVLAWVRFEWRPNLRLSLVTRGELDHAVTPWGIQLSSAEILVEFEHNLYASGVLGGRLEEIITEDIFAKLAELALLATEGRLGPAPIEVGIETARKHAAPSNLSKILAYPNPDWAVTEFGLECVLHSYPIEVDRLDRSRWYEHMREKAWVDIDLFDDALTAAAHLHAALTRTSPDPPSSTSS